MLVRIKLTAAVLLLSVLFLCSCGESPAGTGDDTSVTTAEVPAVPEYSAELCGLWVATVMNISFPSRTGLSAKALRSEIDDIVDTALTLGANALFFQVRGAGDAYYRSDIFPTSKYLVENEGDPLPDGFDPLEYLVMAAHSAGIAVHAWVNPLRAAIGVGSTEELAENNPARLHPEYAVKYADGRYYYDPGLPEVRELIADGVSEIVTNYDVDGVVFDDNFYPYPVTGSDGEIAVFDDAGTYSEYGGEDVSLGDFRRRSVNEMIHASYDAVKFARPGCLFGVAPAGIWKNGTGGGDGSATRGMSSYHDIFCDSLAWVEGGYVDYLAPQIYWSFDSERAPFEELCLWWNDALEGSGVTYYISYAAYRYEDDWEDPQGEMTNQIALAREQKNYRGGAFYGYNQIRDNINGVADELTSAFSCKLRYRTDADGSDGGGSTPEGT